MSTAEKVRTLVSKPLHSRLLLATSLCSTANRAIRDGQIRRAKITLDKLDEILGEAAHLLSSPHGMSLTELRQGQTQVAKLRENLGEIRDAVERALCGVPLETIH